MKRKIVTGSLLLGIMFSFQTFSDSLYDEESYQSMVADVRASALGDSVTILIIEASKAKTNTDTSLNRSLSVSGDLNKNGDLSVGGLDMDIARSGGGITHRQGELKAQLTAEVTRVDSRGRLYVEGQQSIVVNGENQLITLQGWLRPVDIDVNNSALSTRLTGAKIEYIGYGVLDKNQRPGLIFRFLSAIGLI